MKPIRRAAALTFVAAVLVVLSAIVRLTGAPLLVTGILTVLAAAVLGLAVAVFDLLPYERRDLVEIRRGFGPNIGAAVTVALTVVMEMPSGVVYVSLLIAVAGIVQLFAALLAVAAPVGRHTAAEAVTVRCVLPAA